MVFELGHDTGLLSILLAVLSAYVFLWRLWEAFPGRMRALGPVFG